ncbi:SpoIIE family protein phosphatase [Geodermatophilus sp. YIM 151500]|uniref:SpoIIE family protein phosphatase n=1 Tax=Geodermatophilus sp. YIM 151500 TaxID=2984531 RepID=UPI0021E42BDE|nr:SpoIIE family protein phosphatase [Geodermatophilus sp. YIM 151500]MCV2490032.1 SpoIIE family protein phosphatase [Geodermatophilus sp. YIM 151500]
MTAEGSERPPRDLLVQAVEGMARPLLVLDVDWRVSYVNPAGARLLGRTVGGLVGRHAWTEFPEAAGGPFQELYERVRATGVAGSVEEWFEPLASWFRVDAFRTDAGVVVTYDDVTERRALEEERTAALAAREAAAAAAERAGQHLVLIADVGQTLAGLADLDDAVQRFAELLVPLLADWCVVTVFDRGTRRDIGRAHRDPALRAAVHRYADLRAAANTETAPVPRIMRDPAPVVLPELTPQSLAAMVADPASLAALEPLQPTAAAVYPLVAGSELIGAVSLVNGPDRGAHTEEELRTAGIVSRRAALALDNARLAAAGREVAERLQRSLLSPPVQPDSLELVVRYRAATRGVPIGGDWYDAFLQPDGDTVLVIGDVMGHDVEAAAAMGQVRSLVRGIAFDRCEQPAGVLERVDAAIAGLAVPTLATALVCRVEQDRDDRRRGLRRLRWSSAGHPDPVLVGPDGAVSELGAPVGPPLGVGWDGRRVDGEVVLVPGSTLVLFTDGLFERRGVPLDDGRARLLDVLAGSSGRPLPEVCDELLARLVGAGAEDDVAVLAVRAHPEDRPAP